MTAQQQHQSTTLQIAVDPNHLTRWRVDAKSEAMRPVEGVTIVASPAAMVTRVMASDQLALKHIRKFTFRQRRAFHRFILYLYMQRWFAALAVSYYPHGLCGGDLPPCWVMQRESKGNPTAVNPGHMGAPYGDPGDPWTHASGKWQDMPSTWGGYAGYPYAAAAPERVQDEFNRHLYATQGMAPWACC